MKFSEISKGFTLAWETKGKVLVIAFSRISSWMKTKFELWKHFEFLKVFDNAFFVRFVLSETSFDKICDD